jgi:hypothetical protein
MHTSARWKLVDEIGRDVVGFYCAFEHVSIPANVMEVLARKFHLDISHHNLSFKKRPGTTAAKTLLSIIQFKLYYLELQYEH